MFRTLREGSILLAPSGRRHSRDVSFQQTDLSNAEPSRLQSQEDNAWERPLARLVLWVRADENACFLKPPTSAKKKKKIQDGIYLADGQNVPHITDFGAARRRPKHLSG